MEQQPVSNNLPATGSNAGSDTGLKLSPGASHGSPGDEDLRLLADSAGDFAMLFTDPERNIVRWSAGAEQVLGWTEQEAINKDERDLIYTPEDIAAGIPQQEMDQALKDGRADDDRWHLKKDGTRFFASGVMVPLYDPTTGELRGYGKVLRDMTAKKRLEEQLQQTNETLEARVQERTRALNAALAEKDAALAEKDAALQERQALLERVIDVQEEERRRISREMHDQTGQHLTGLSLALKALEDSSVEAVSVLLLERLRAITQELARDIHRIAVELRPTALDDMGLVPALQNYVEQWEEHTGTPVDFAAIGFDSYRFPFTLETTVYRVVQEALTNVAKYAVPAGATQVVVTLQRRDSHIRATIEDNGPGFDMDGARNSGRLGLLGMQERAQLAGGSVDIESSLGAGTTIFLHVPVAIMTATTPAAMTAAE